MHEEEAHHITALSSLQLLAPLLPDQQLKEKERNQELQAAEKDILRCEVMRLFLMHSTIFLVEESLCVSLRHSVAPGSAHEERSREDWGSGVTLGTVALGIWGCAWGNGSRGLGCWWR